jgi:hypothetical protein
MRIFFLGLMAFLVSIPAADACTNFIVTKCASQNGSSYVTYAADSHTLYGELYYNAAANYPAGTMIQIVDWDSGKKLIKIPPVESSSSGLPP